MRTVFEVANWFLSQGEITHKKLQKLCYYAQAWFCALYSGDPFFGERIEAWVHGPVIPELYRIYANRGWDLIPIYNGELFFSEKENSILAAVYNTYWSLDGDQLETLTHNEEPWKLARGSLMPWEKCTNEITVESMRIYYARLYQESQSD